MLRMTIELANTYTDTVADSPDKEGKIFELQSRTNKLKTDMQTAFFQPNVNMRIEKIPEKTTASPEKTMLLDMSKMSILTPLASSPTSSPTSSRARRSSPSPETRLTQQSTRILEEAVDVYNYEYSTNFEQQQTAKAIAIVARRLIRSDNHLYPQLNTSGPNLTTLYSVEPITAQDAKKLQQFHDLGCECECIDADGLDSCLELLQKRSHSKKETTKEETTKEETTKYGGKWWW